MTQLKKFGFGLMRLPTTSDKLEDIDMERFKEMADFFIDRGYGHFDTAWIYHSGKSESAFREAVVKRHPRNKFTLTDKMPIFSIESEEQMAEVFDEQLARCGVDYFDFYWIHSINERNYEKALKYKAFDFVVKKKEGGKIKNIGFSFHDSADFLDKILANHPEMAYVMLQINYLDWEDKNIQSRKCYEVARKHNRLIFVMEPLKGGSLINVPPDVEELLKSHNNSVSPASWAFRYAASLEGVVNILSGVSNMKQLKENLDIFDNMEPLTDEEYKVLERAADLILAEKVIPCTICHYCTDTCPQNIAIPEYFTIYNTFKRMNEKPTIEIFAYLRNLLASRGKPSDCIDCGHCESACPQNIPIVENLGIISEKWETAK